MRAYDWLLFDADGTLFDYDRAERTALARACAAAGLGFDDSLHGAYRTINRALWAELEFGRISPAALKVRRFELLLKQLGADLPAHEFSECYLDHLGRSADLVSGAEELLRDCSAHYRMALLTNGLSRVQRARLSCSSISDRFAAVIISEEIGAAKPEGAFFARAFEAIGSPGRRRALMIGDNWSSDICGAAAFGLDACWFNPGGSQRPSAPEIALECASLQELRDQLLAPV